MKHSKEVDEKAKKYLKEGYKSKEYNHVVPSIQGLAEYLDVCEKTLNNWHKDKVSEDFLRTYEMIKTKQHNIALANGLTGDFNSAITKLLLHNHGYSDKTDSTLRGDEENPIKVIERTVIDPKDNGVK